MSQLREPQEPVRKDNRLQIRVDEEAYHVLEKAACYRHGSLSQFVREASLKEAEKIIREHEAMTLSNQDWVHFLDALSYPAKPNIALQEAYVRYKKTLQK
ncbi:MAG: DUF1778 domain-containing protein [Alphaproteobacteria bacterium]|nr:DUF1778 domain-containing protein [Alphaproteobacteria bacterium]MBP9776281.1 DUF1778 domain-containing protein [Alphaproteobacteria bacterium]MDP3442081.1 DUF1778 domain-containing protein [Ignavibacteria bacterium]